MTLLMVSQYCSNKKNAKRVTRLFERSAQKTGSLRDGSQPREVPFKGGGENECVHEEV